MSFQRIENFIDFLVNACSKAMEIRVSSNNFHIMGQAKHLSGCPTMKCPKVNGSEGFNVRRPVSQIKKKQTKHIGKSITQMTLPRYMEVV